ncbi:hypothetical protein [Peterkaempfera bronchialis]|uniref:hypothetical protein n=1 Tax=Peterkaempfera bronchialis TaxID=2126346 RepID=UPI003C2C0F12
MYKAEVVPHRAAVPARRPFLADRLPPPVQSAPLLPTATTATTGRVRAGLAVLSLATGVGLLLGPTVGAALDPGRVAAAGLPAADERFALARTLWRTAPADSLLPPTLTPGDGSTWTRTAVAADTACTPAALGRDLYAALAPVGCARLLRATYTDLARSRLVTVGIVTTKADRTATARFAAARRTAPTPAPATDPATPAATWTVRADPARPWLVWTAAAFADGRTVHHPAPAGPASADDPHAPLVEAGLPDAARHLAAAIRAALDHTLTTAWHQTHPTPEAAR